MSKKEKGILIITGVLAVMVSITVISALAVHDLGLFELDRNAQDDGSVTGDDWNTLPGGVEAEFTGIIADVAELNPLGSTGTQFQAGGSKDDLDISPGGATGQHWKWDPGEPLDKDDITNAYAAAYLNATDTGENNIGDLIIYFGLDRFANNGSAQVGFWFLQDPEFGLTTTPSGGGYLFSGHHVVGDILVQSNFSGGGIIDTISVYKWVGSGGSNGTLDLLFFAQDCLTTGVDAPACATVNQGDTPAPWPFTPKFGTPGTFPQGSFFEGGINISRLVPDAGCFTGFLAETRSSTPFDSRLKDFALGEFDLCSIEVEKTGDGLSKVGDDVDYSITITNTGSITLYLDDISDDVLGDFYLNGVDQNNPLVTGDTCGPALAPAASCTITATRTVLDTDPDPLPNTVEVTYRGKPDLSGTAVYDDDDHSVNLFQPNFTVTKEGDTLSKIGDDVTYTFTIVNTSSSDSPDLNLVSINDNKLGDLSTAAISAGCDVLTSNPAETCSFDVVHTIPAGAGDPYDNEITVVYQVAGFPNQITRTDTHSVNLFQPNFTVTKEGDTLSKIGDDVTYTFTIVNTSSNDSPNLNLVSIDDDKLGDLSTAAMAAGCDVLTSDPAETCSFDVVHTIPVEAGDSYDNEVTVMYQVAGFPNQLVRVDTHSVNLFQPNFTVTKEGDTLSKIGDDVTYTFTIVNTSSSDSPDLNLVSISDNKLGDLSTAATAAECDVLTSNPAETCSFDVVHTVPAGAGDPYDNEITVVYQVAGFPNQITRTDTHSVNLFQPNFTVTKEGDTLSKIGDDVTYTFTIVNTSSNDSPNLNLVSISDDKLGDLSTAATAAGCDVLTSDPAETCSFDVVHTIPVEAGDPYDNEVTVVYQVARFPNQKTRTDTHSVNLFQPSITFDKTGDTYSKIGDDVSYTITLNNTSSGDTPDLECTITDAMLGIDKSVILASGTGNVTNATHTVTEGEGAGDTLNNTASVSCSPVGFPNVLDASDGHSVTLIHPDFTVAKTCDSEPVSYEGPAYFTVTIANTGDVPLNITADDGIGAFSLTAGASQSFAVSEPGPFTPGGTAENTVTASWTLPAEYGLSNTDTKSATDSCDVVEPVYETAYAKGEREDNPVCFLDLGANNWGWVNGDGDGSILPGEYTWEVWAGAAQCKTNKGILVGTVDVNYDGTDVSVTFNIDPQHVLGDTHVYADYDPVPPGGFAPGQYEIYGPFDGRPIYVIVHAVVAIMP